jgi:hypothetical protein
MITQSITTPVRYYFIPSLELSQPEGSRFNATPEEIESALLSLFETEV